MELITKEDCTEVIDTLETLLENFNHVTQNFTPSLNGEKYLTTEMVCNILNISKRTLQEYRDNRQISYIPLFGKILYKESDIRLLLEENYIPQLKY